MGPGSAAHALCVINISSHERGARPAGAGGGPGPHGPPPGSACVLCNIVTMECSSEIVVRMRI